MSHGAPVESVLVYPTGGGGVACSAGGPVVRVWDLMMGGRGLKALSNHQKGITSMALSMNTGAEGPAAGGLDSSDAGMRLLSAGLDGLVKVYDPAKDYRVVHTMRYPSPILTLAISPEERELAVGMADGTLCVRKREVKKTEEEARALERSAYTAQGAGGVGGGGLEAFLPYASSGMAGGEDDASRRLEAQARRNALLAQDDVRGETIRARRLKPYDKLMKSFRYSQALDAVLRPGIPASVVFALLLELKRRGGVSSQAANAGAEADGLRRAIGGRDEVGLEPLLRFLLRHAANPMWNDIVCDTLEVVLDIYSSTLGLSPVIDSLFSRLWAKVSDEVRLQDEVQGVRGGLEMLLHRSLIGR